MKAEEISSGVLGVLGMSIGLSDVQNILNLILIVLSIINILIVMFLKIRDHVKKKEIEKVADDVTEAMESLDKIAKSAVKTEQNCDLEEVDEQVCPHEDNNAQ